MNDDVDLFPKGESSVSVQHSAGAFEELLVPQLERAYRVAVSLCHHPSDAENLVQEASFRAFRAFSTFQIGTNFRAWFLQIVTRCFYESHRQRKRRPEQVELEDDLDAFLYQRAQALPGDPAETLFAQLSGATIARAIGELPEEFALAASLYFQEDLSYQEIADILKAPLGTVRSRIHRARKALQRSLWTLAQEQGLNPKEAR